MKRVAIVDYSIGNVFSVMQACKTIELDPFLTDDPEQVKSADAVILPGVGAFGKGIYNLKAKGLDRAIHSVIDSGKPFFGICLGMQLLLGESEEFEKHEGLGVFKGGVLSFRRVVDDRTPVPQVMWNEVGPDQQSWAKTPLEGTKPGTHFYFVHSYYCSFEEKVGLTKTAYFGHEYSSSVSRDNVFATQFHPEKSGKDGLMIYRKWKELFLDK